MIPSNCADVQLNMRSGFIFSWKGHIRAKDKMKGFAIWTDLENLFAVRAAHLLEIAGGLDNGAEETSTKLPTSCIAGDDRFSLSRHVERESNSAPDRDSR